MNLHIYGAKRPNWRLNGKKGSCALRAHLNLKKNSQRFTLPGIGPMGAVIHQFGCHRIVQGIFYGTIQMLMISYGDVVAFLLPKMTFSSNSFVDLSGCMFFYRIHDIWPIHGISIIILFPGPENPVNRIGHDTPGVIFHMGVRPKWQALGDDGAPVAENEAGCVCRLLSFPYGRRVRIKGKKIFGSITICVGKFITAFAPLIIDFRLQILDNRLNSNLLLKSKSKI